jgi:predicted PurR-regulated permease PerM
VTPSKRGPTKAKAGATKAKPRPAKAKPRPTKAKAPPVEVDDRADLTNPDVDVVKPEDEVPRWLRRAIALFFAWAVGLIAAYWVLSRLKPIIIMFVVALFLSLALEPVVNKLVQHGWRRGAATALVATGVLIGAIGFIVAFGSVAFTQASELVDNAPHYVRNVVRFLNDDFGAGINAHSLIKELQSKNGAVHQFGQDLADSAPDIGLKVAEATFQIIVTFVFAFYLTADGPRFRRAVCSRLPRRRQQIVLDTWEIAVEKTGAYLYSRTLQAIVCTAAASIFFFALGVPSPFALAIWVGVVSQFIPSVGTYIALVLPALVTLVNSPVDTIWVLAYLVGYQQFENYFLGPRIARFTLHIHPALTIGTVFAGALLFGPVGALLALPTTAVIQALLSTYTEEQEVIETALTKEPRRRRFRIPRFSLRRGKARRDAASEH